MRQALVIIDMQEGATRSNYHGRYLDKKWWRQHTEVVAKIKALSKKMKTIFLVYTCFRRKEHIEIIPEFRSIAQRSRLLFKNGDDGSNELATHIPPRTHIYLCGMNTDACVLRTARGLKKRGYRVTVIGDACWTVYANISARPHHQALHSLRRSEIAVIKASAFLRRAG